MSHFYTLITVDVPQGLAPLTEKEKAEIIERFSAYNTYFENTRKMLINCNRDSFSHYVYDKVNEKMEKYTYEGKEEYKEFFETGESKGYDFVEAEGAYGFYINPYAFCDYYRINGSLLLVKADCKEYSVGETMLELPEGTADDCPEGYRWAVAARKKDIQWEAMREWRTHIARTEFERYESSFKAGEMLGNEPIRSLCEITEKGIVLTNKSIVLTNNGMIYSAGETFEQWSQRFGENVMVKHRFVNDVYAYLDDFGQYHDIWRCGGKRIEKYLSFWTEKIDKYLNMIDDDAVLVVLDCHT